MLLLLLACTLNEAEAQPEAEGPVVIGITGATEALIQAVEAAGAQARPILPTEESHISRGEAREGCRLACQVKVKGDMDIEIEPEVFGVRKWECDVIGNGNVATFIKEFKLKLPEGESVPFRAGGYIQIECPPHVAK